MTGGPAPWGLWGKMFRQFRLHAGYASQTELADALSHLELTLGKALVLSTTQISRWENGKRCPSRREQHLLLIEGMVRLKGITTPEEANFWLQAGNQGVLSSDEVRLLFAEASLTPVEPNHQELMLPPNATMRITSASQDWGDAPVTVAFHGRQAETVHLRQWVLSEDCRVVAILGMGGVGKTAMAAHLARDVADEFDGVFWRSLLNAPPLDDILRTWLHFLSHHKLPSLPTSLDERLRLLIDYLRQQRYLLVLDNCEAIFQDGPQAGRYRPGHEEYGQLLRWLVGQEHHSCLILTSREKPHDISRLEQGNNGVCVFNLVGLEPEAGRALLREQGVRALTSVGDDLVTRYSGNPLALKLVADTIREIFGGDVMAFLSHETPLFDDIREVLDQQFGRLSALERDLIIWLAVEREPLSLADLASDLVQPVSQGEMLTALRALQRRSLLERVDDTSDRISHESLADSHTGVHGRYTLQNVVTEYLTERLLATVYREVLDQRPNWLNRYTLRKAQAKEYVRQSQERLLLAPVARRLEAGLGRVGLESRLKGILNWLRTETPLAPGYAAGNVLNLLLHLDYDARGYDFSRLAVWQAYLRGKNVQEVDFSLADLVGCVFTDTFGSIDAVTFSPDGNYMASSADGEIRIWRATAGWFAPQSHLSCQGHTTWASTINFSPDSRTLASGSADQTIRLWDVETGVCLHVLHGHTGIVVTVSFSPDGRTLVSGSADQTVRLWDVQAGECLDILQGHTHTAWWMHFGLDGRTVASSRGDQTIRLWDGQTGEVLRVLQGHVDWVNWASFSPDGRTLASGSYDHTVRLWDVQTGRTLHVLEGHTKWLISVAFRSDGRVLASGSDDYTVRLWDVQTGKCLSILEGHTQPVRSVSFSPDGQTLVSGSDDQTIRLWDVRSGTCLHILQGYQNTVVSISFSPNGRTLASGSDDRIVRLWDVHTGEVLHAMLGHDAWVGSVSVSPDGRTVASGSDDRTVRLWDVQTGVCLRILQGHTARVSSVSFSPDGRILASAGGDRDVWLWDAQTGEALGILEGHTNWVRSVCFSPDGRTVASSSIDRTVRLWDIQTKQPLRVLSGHTRTVESISFSPDGRTIATGSQDQTVRLWNVQTGEDLAILHEHTSWVRSICLAPNGRTLASGSDDQTVRLWDAQTGAPLAILVGHTQSVRSVSFAPDGGVLASSSADQTIRLWDLQTRTCLRILRSDRPYERMKITSATGLTAGQVATLNTLGATGNG